MSDIDPESPDSPDPWGKDEDQAPQELNATPLCLRCLGTHSAYSHFCPHCGATTGEFTSFSPYLYVLSLGDLLRQGTSGRFRVSGCTVAGYVLLSLSQYTIFAPIYWYLLVRNVRRLQVTTGSTEAPREEDAPLPDA